MNARGKFLIGSGIIVATLVALAYVGYTQSKTYYHTISELPTLSGIGAAPADARFRQCAERDRSRIRMAAWISSWKKKASNCRSATSGRDPLPDTFKDGAQALVEGSVMPDGQFTAEQVQAKCASKYEANAGSRPAPRPRASSARPIDEQFQRVPRSSSKS